MSPFQRGFSDELQKLGNVSHGLAAAAEHANPYAKLRQAAHEHGAAAGKLQHLGVGALKDKAHAALSQQGAGMVKREGARSIAEQAAK